MFAAVKSGCYCIIDVHVHICEVDGHFGHDRKAAFWRIGDARERVNRGDFDGEVHAADTSKVCRQHQEIGRVGERWKCPREKQWERKPFGWRIVDFVEFHHNIFESEHRPRVDIERQVEVDRTGARFFGMKVDFPQLTKRIGLDEVPFVVNVKSVIDGLTFHIGHKSCHVDHCHAFRTLPSLNVDTPHEIGRESEVDDPESVLDLFASISDRAMSVVSATTDWGESGRRPGQYNVDLDMDDVCVEPLLAAGFDVLSEESGVQLCADSQHSSSQRYSKQHMVVVDPLDGSTNASLGLPWFATSLCLVVAGIPAVSMVTNLATGDRYTAARGSGATHGGEPLTITHRATLDDAVIAVSGLPEHHYGWRQFRAMGASALGICAVAGGSFDGFVDMSSDAHGVWDYLGALLVLEEAGGRVVDALGRDLVVLEHDVRRTPVAATSDNLLKSLLAERQR